MRVALVHDWLTGMRGGERVLEELVGMFPGADLFTLIHVPGATSPRIDSCKVHTSFLSRMPGIASHYRGWLPLFPLAVRQLDLSGYELVISCSHAVAKSVRVPPGARHLSYCLTPMRYVWDQADAYLGRGLRRALASPLVASLRHYDRRTSRADRVHRFVAISSGVQDRISRHYDRRSNVVHPPVATDRIVPSGREPDDFYLLVGGFVPYKREDIALDAFRSLGRRLVVAGEGPGRKRLQVRAPANVEFTGRIGDVELADLFASCRALIHPQDEDFGIAAVEAQAAGRPVIALGRGGAVDTVRPLGEDDAPAERATGLWFERQTPGDLVAAVERFEKYESRFDPLAIRSWAEGFSAERFRRELHGEVEAVLVATPG